MNENHSLVYDILTILQIGDADYDLLTRFFALASLMCALISLVFGSVFIIWFGRMAKLRSAAQWAFVRLPFSLGILTCH